MPLFVISVNCLQGNDDGIIVKFSNGVAAQFTAQELVELTRYRITPDVTLKPVN